MLTVGSLFSGIGGIEKGLEDTGHFITKFQVENDTYATRVLERHWPNARRWDDVQTFPPDTEQWHVDLICAGFPCQDISYAGRGAGIAGERSGLFYEAARIVGVLGPRYVLLENVSALRGRGLGDVLGTLASFGYDAEWHCISAAAVGAPHIRDRVFILAYTSELFSDGSNNNRSRRHRQIPEFGNSNEKTRSVGNWWSDQCRLGIHFDGSASRLDGCGGWECGIPRVTRGQMNRVDRLRCLGNAVVPQVAEWVGEYIWHCLENNERNS